MQTYAAVAASSHLLACHATRPVFRTLHQPGENWLACHACGSANPEGSFVDFHEFTIETTKTTCVILHQYGHSWQRSGDVCGQSSAARLKALGIPI
jgi:hypothetical protein